MEQNCLAGTQKSGLRSRTLYRVAAVGIATLITQASPGGAASSWGVECLTTDLANNSYCVTSLNDDIPSDSAAWTLRTNEATWTLRKSVDEANIRAADSATIGFQDSLFGIQRNGAGAVINNSQTPLDSSSPTPSNPTIEKTIVLNSTLEIKTNITIAAPTDKDGHILLTIERGNAITSGSPLISVNPTADPASVPAANPTTTEVKIENVTIQSRANKANPQDASGTFATPGVAIQVASTTAPGDNVTTVTPDVVLKSSQVLNAVSESGGAAVNTPGNVRVEGSTLVGNVAITPSGGAPTDGGAIKAGGTVTVVSSALNNNSATGNGGAISASSVNVSNAENSSNSQLIGNTAGGSGGAINSSGNTVISGATLEGNTAGGMKSAVDPVAPPTATPTGGDGGAVNAGSTVQISESQLTGNQALKGTDSNSTTGNGGAISAGDQVTVSASTLNNNTAELGSGGAISTEGNVSVSGSTLAGNAATAGSGGAISTSGVSSTVAVTNSGLVNNTAGGDGGAISTTGVSSTVAVTNSGLGNNTAGGDGGAISASGTTGAVSVTNSSLGVNTASGNGGAIAAGGAVTVNSSSVLVSNSATSGNGGAIAAGGDVTIANSGFGNNTAGGNGGAISVTGATSAVEVTNSGLASNTAGGNGGAISVTGATSAVEVTNSVLAFNIATSGNGGAIATTGTSSTVSVSNSGLGYNAATIGNGGAIATTGASSAVQITDSSIAENRAGQNGGGISSAGQVTIGSNSPTPTSTPTTGNSESTLNASTTSEATGSTFSASTSISLTLGSNVYTISAGQGNNGSDDIVTNPSGSIIFRNTAASGNGGAISAQGEISVTTGSNIYANTASKDGGAISSQSAVAIANSAVSNNIAGGNGGAISSGGDVAVQVATLSSNTAGATREPDPQALAPTVNGGNGGAISAGGDVTITQSVLEKNEAVKGVGDGAVTGNGGAISAVGTSRTVTVNDSGLNENYSRGTGGAIYANSVEVSGSEFFDNAANAYGGAIDIVDESNSESTIQDSEFSDNTGEYGGAIDGNRGALSISSSSFFRNSATSDKGGAIWHESQLYVTGSTFSGNTAEISGGAIYSEGDVEILNSSFGFDGLDLDESHWNGAIEGSGGAVYSEGDISFIRSIAAGNYSGTSGGALFAEGEVLINASLFFLNQSLGNGGAIFSETKVVVENGSLMFANTAGVPADFEFGFPFLYPIPTNQVQCPEGLCRGGNGGAIYSEGDVNVSGSRIGLDSLEPDGPQSLYANAALCGEDFGSNGPSPTCSFVEWNNQSPNYKEVGNGGGVYAVGKVTIEGSETSFAFDPTMVFGLFPKPIASFEYSLLTNNYAENNGGAIYALGGLSVTNAKFGSIPQVNPDYNPIVVYSQNPNYSPDEYIENPNFNPYVEVINPAYNPIGMVTNPTYNIEVSKFIDNPKYNISVPRQIANAACPSGSTIYNGEDFGNGPVYGCEYTINNEDGSFSFRLLPLYVDNPDYDDRLSLDNPLYDDREFVPGLLKPELPENNSQFISVLTNPDKLNDEEEFISNPNQDTREELPQLRHTDMPQDDKKFIYSGNMSGNDGGAIYVEGPAEIRETLFAGNKADDDGGAIYSLGGLEIYDSQFKRNWAGDDGGAIRTTPADGDLLIARSEFMENVALEDGGGIRISTVSEAHYDDVILSSLFEKNEAFEAGGAISSSFAILVLNTFSENRSPRGQALDLDNGILSGNLLIGVNPATDEPDMWLCSRPVFAEHNFATDSSCFYTDLDESGNPSQTPLGINNQIIELPVQVDSKNPLLPGYGDQLLNNFRLLPEFYTEMPSEDSPGALSALGEFVTAQYNLDYSSRTREPSVLWTAGHLQLIFPDEPNPTDPEEPTNPKDSTNPKDAVDPSNPVDPGNSGSNPSSDLDPKKPPVTEQPNGHVGGGNSVVIPTPESNNNVTPILITQPVLTPEELIRLAQLRAEQLAAELARQQEAQKAAADRLAKIKADKLAREKARALAAEKRRAQLAALKAKIAATQARGEALKKKPSWINLMKHSSTPKAVKSLVMTPAK